MKARLSNCDLRDKHDRMWLRREPVTQASAGEV